MLGFIGAVAAKALPFVGKPLAAEARRVVNRVASGKSPIATRPAASPTPAPVFANQPFTSPGMPVQSQEPAHALATGIRDIVREVQSIADEGRKARVAAGVEKPGFTLSKNVMIGGGIAAAVLVLLVVVVLAMRGR